jgi:hypothetical protein
LSNFISTLLSARYRASQERFHGASTGRLFCSSSRRLFSTLVGVTTFALVQATSGDVWVLGGISLLFPGRYRSPSPCLKMRRITAKIRSYHALFPETLGDIGNKPPKSKSTYKCNRAAPPPLSRNRSSTNFLPHARVGLVS